MKTMRVLPIALCALLLVFACKKKEVEWPDNGLRDVQIRSSGMNELDNECFKGKSDTSYVIDDQQSMQQLIDCNYFSPDVPEADFNEHSLIIIRKHADKLVSEFSDNLKHSPITNEYTFQLDLTLGQQDSDHMVNYYAVVPKLEQGLKVNYEVTLK